MANVQTLTEALPYIREFRGQTFVIRCASQLSDEELAALCEDIAMLRYVGVKTVVIHPHEAGGVDRDGADPHERANQRLVHAIGGHVQATGLSGADGAPRWLLSISADGQLITNADLVEHVIDDYTPVIEAVAVDASGRTRPADPDLAAAKLAGDLGAYKVLFVVGDHRLTIDDPEESGEISEMRSSPDLVERVNVPPEIAGPFQAALEAVGQAVGSAHLIPRERPHALLLELFTDAGYGTKIRNADAWAEEPTFPARGYWCWSASPDDLDADPAVA